jgi:hypothetical protein
MVDELTIVQAVVLLEVRHRRAVRAHPLRIEREAQVIVILRLVVVEEVERDDIGWRPGGRREAADPLGVSAMFHR